MNEVAKRETAEVATPERQPTMLDVIRYAVTSPEVDVAKLGKLVELQMQIERRSAEVEFNAAKARLQAKLPQIEASGAVVVTPKDGGAARLQSRYAKYEDIDLIIRPLLAEEGFSLEFDSQWADSKLVMSGTLAHRLGHSSTKTLPLPLDTSGNKNGIQAAGSAVSYGRRYLTLMLLNIVTKGQDDDGNAGGNKPISQDQVTQINDLLKEIGATDAKIGKFCDWLKVQSVPDIKREDYKRAVEYLERKRAER